MWNMFTPRRSAILQGLPGRDRWDTFVQDAGPANGQWPIYDVGVAGNPADVREAPVDILGMDVLVIFRCPCDIRKISPSAMLASLGLCRRSAGVHQKQGSLGGHGHRVYGFSTILLQQLVNDVVSALDHGRRRGVFPRISLPYQDFVDLNAVPLGLRDRLIGLGLMIEKPAFRQ